MSSCVTDIDCPGTLVCYNTSWTNHQSTCLCSTWFGFSGPNCEFALQTSTSTWRVANSIFFSLAWCAVFLVGVASLRKLSVFTVVHPQSAEEGRSSTGWSVTHTCQVQLVIATALSMTAEILGIITTLSPLDLKLFLPGTDRKTSTLFYPKQILTSLSYCFIFLALVTLPLHWREIANQAFRPNKKKLSYLWPLVAFEILFSAITLIFVALSMPSAAYISAIPFVIIVVALYGIGGLSLWRILTKAAKYQGAEQRNRFLKSAQTVANTSLKMFAIGVGIIVMNTVFALTSGDPQWRELSRPDAISTPVVIGSILNLFLLSAAAFGQFYLSTTIRASVARQQSSYQQGDASRNTHGNHQNKQVADDQPMLANHPGGGGGGASSTQERTVDHSAQPDSIVGLSDKKAIKSKRKILKRKGGPRRLRPITDMTVEATHMSTNPIAEVSDDILAEHQENSSGGGALFSSGGSGHGK